MIEVAFDAKSDFRATRTQQAVSVGTVLMMTADVSRECVACTQ